MADPKRLTKWQERDLRVLNAVFGINTKFEARAEVLREIWEDLSRDDRIFAITELLRDYRLPLSSRECVENYVLKQQVDPSLITSSIKIESEKDRTIEPSSVPPWVAKHIHEMSRERFKIPEVRLILSPQTTRKELDDFLNTYWTAKIQPRLDNIYGKRTKRVKGFPKAKRDEEVRTMAREGTRYEEIADYITKKYYNNGLDGEIYTPENVAQAVARRRN